MILIKILLQSKLITLLRKFAKKKKTVNPSSSHCCGFEPSLGQMLDKPSSACGWFFSGISHFCPILWLTRLEMSKIILKGHKTKIKKEKEKKNLKLPLNLSHVFFIRVMCPKDAGRMANSVHPDQTDRSGAVWSGSTLYVYACLSKNFWSLW